MRRFFVALVALAILGFAAQVNAELKDQSFGAHLGQAKTDSLKWVSGGAQPITASGYRDTFVASALNDTTYAVDIGGATQVSITLVVTDLTGSTSSLGTVYPQVSDNHLHGGMWHTLNTAWTVSTSAADTTLFLALNNTAIDSVLSAQTGMVAATHGDQAYVRSARHLRLWYAPGGQALDSSIVYGTVTRIYPR